MLTEPPIDIRKAYQNVSRNLKGRPYIYVE